MTRLCLFLPLFVLRSGSSPTTRTCQQYPKEAGSQQTECWKQRRQEKLWKKVSSFVLFPASQLPNPFGPSSSLPCFCIPGTHASDLNVYASPMCQCVMPKRHYQWTSKRVHPIPHTLGLTHRSSIPVSSALRLCHIWDEMKQQREYVARSRDS